jgi:molybdate transport system substrate-binding protein
MPLKKTYHNRVASILFASLVVSLVVSSACFRQDPISKLVIFASAGGKPAIDEICQRFEEHYQIQLETNYGGGGEILSKMILAKRGDLYVAPEQKFMEAAQAKNAVVPTTIQTVAYLLPVIAVKKGNPKGIHSLNNLANEGIRLAITRPETTLLGKYAPEIFRKAGLEKTIMKNVVTYASDPNSLLTMLIMGQIDAGIIWHFYGTVAIDHIEIIFIALGQLTGIGEMRIAVSAYSKNSELARQFVAFATSAEGKAVFKKYGYVVETEEVDTWRK